jgi:methyl-accepting chemotaxis protein
MVGMGLYSLNRMEMINQHTVLMGSRLLPRANTINRILTNASDYRRGQLQHLVASETADYDKQEKRMTNDESIMQQLFEEFKPLVETEQDRAYYEDIQADWAQFVSLSQPFIAPSRAGDKITAKAVLNGDAKKVNDGMSAKIAEWITYNQSLADARVQDAETAYRATMTASVAVIVAAAALAIFLGIFQSRTLAKGIRQLLAAAQAISDVDLKALALTASQIAEGDLTHSFQLKTETVAYQSSDALGDLARVFNQMVQRLYETGDSFGQMRMRLSDLIAQVGQDAQNLNATSENLSRAAGQAGSATSQIATTIQQVARGAVQQADSVTGTGASMERMSKTIEGVSKGAQEQAQAVAEASQATADLSQAVQRLSTSAKDGANGGAAAAEASQEGVASLKKTMSVMDTIRLKVGHSAGKVKEMGEKSKQIDMIVQTIDDIASQTNMLALNAAIEAARAGEHGKGFAVVADEVRKLAEKSTHSTKEIAELIHGIQVTVDEAVRAMDESIREVESGVDRVHESGQTLDRIQQLADVVYQSEKAAIQIASQAMDASSTLVSAMDRVSAVVDQNTSATEVMAMGSAEVTRAVENIASVSEENSAAVEEVSASAEEMSAQVEELSSSAQALADMASSLFHAVGRFKVENKSFSSGSFRRS